MRRLAVAALLLTASAATAAPPRTAAPSTAAGAAVALPPGTSLQPYTVRQGDTLIGLAQRLRLGPDGWRLLQRINGTPNPFRIPVGSTLRLPLPEPSPPTSAGIAAWRGAVTLERAGAIRPISADLRVQEGDRVVTGANAFVTLSLPDGSFATLPSNSVVLAERLRRGSGVGQFETRFALGRGGLEARAAPQRAGSRLEIRTPVAVAAVRGTEFRVGADAAGAKVEVLDGAVGFAGAGGETRLTAGMGTIAGAQGVEPPSDLLPPPTVTALEPGSRSRPVDLRLTVAPVAGARGYRFEAAQDAGFLDRLGSIEVATPSGALSGLPRGVVFVRAAAIDARGLVGLPVVVAVRNASGPDGPPISAGPVGCATTVACVYFRVAAPTPGVRSRLVIARAGAAASLFDRAIASDRVTVVGLPTGVYDWYTVVDAADGERRSHPQRFELRAAAPN